MEDFSALHAGERTLFEALARHGVRFMLVGLSAAVLQGANTGTRDLDLWLEDVSDPRIADAVREAHGIWISGTFGMRPPQIGGNAVGDRVDVVTHLHGLRAFADEYANAIEMEIDGLTIRVLPVERIIASKRAAGRTKDIAALPALEEALAAIRGKLSME
jgi:predicted nucleotidyltransferase